MLDLIPPGRAVSVEYDVFPLLVGAGLYAHSRDGAWRDIGTPASYLAANLERMPAGGLVDPSARVDPSASVTGSVVGPGCRIGAGARGVRVGASRGAVVAEGETVENRVDGSDWEPVW